MSGIDDVVKVSVDWDTAIDQLQLQRRTINDMSLPLSAWEPAVENGQFGLSLRETGQFFAATRWAMKKLAVVAKCREFDWMAEDLRHPATIDKTTGEKKVLWTRDDRDAELIKHFVSTHLFQADRVNQDKKLLFRTWQDGTLRAVLSERYAKIDNMWFVNLIRERFPDHRVFRWRGDADTIQFDVLLPEMQSNDNESEYGGILHVGNSEIGQRSVIAVAGVVRAICTNGMIIMDRDCSFRKRHMGEIDLESLGADIYDNIDAALPEIQDGMQRIFDLRTRTFDKPKLPNIFAQFGIEHTISKKHVRGMFEAWQIEKEIVGDDVAHTAFGLQAAITRYSQKLPATLAHEYDVVGGLLANDDETSWNRFVKRAENMTDKQVERRFGEM